MTVALNLEVDLVLLPPALTPRLQTEPVGGERGDSAVLLPAEWGGFGAGEPLP